MKSKLKKRRERMGEKLTEIRAIQIGDMRIDISGHPEITEFTYDEDAVQEYLENSANRVVRWNESECTFSVQLKVNRIIALKLSGSWDWVIENCPDKRVRHLIKYHKDDRVKMKNWRHAVKLIGKMLEAKL
jgi:hypothetical protein